MATKQCDYGHDATKVRRLDTGGGSAVIVCKVHWNKEMAWRKQRNKELAKRGALTKNSRFNIRKWPG